MFGDLINLSPDFLKNFHVNLFVKLTDIVGIVISLVYTKDQMRFKVTLAT